MHVDHHQTLYHKLASTVSPALLERFWRLRSRSFHLDRAPILEDQGVLVIFAFDTPIYVCKCENGLDELSDQYASILSGEWVEAYDVDARRVLRQRLAWEYYLEHSFDESDTDARDELVPLAHYTAFFLFVDCATDRTMWASLLISTLRPACNTEVFDDAEVDAVVGSDLSDPPTSEQMRKLVTVDGRYIRYLEEPEEALQLLAVEQNPWALAEILNMGRSPSRDVLLAAVQGDGLTLRLIEKPDREMQQVAVASDGNAIRYVRNPDEELQLTAVNNAPGALGWIAKPSYQAKLSGVGHVPQAITLVDLEEREADYDLLLLAFRKEPTVIRRLRRLPQSFWDYLCQHDPLARVERMLRDNDLNRFLLDSMKETLLPRLLQLLKEGRNTDTLDDYLTVLQENQIEWPELSLIRRAVATIEAEAIQQAIDQLQADMN